MLDGNSGAVLDNLNPDFVIKNRGTNDEHRFNKQISFLKKMKDVSYYIDILPNKNNTSYVMNKYRPLIGNITKENIDDIYDKILGFIYFSKNNKIYHGDLTISNMLLDENDNVIFIDPKGEGVDTIEFDICKLLLSTTLNYELRFFNSQFEKKEDIIMYLELCNMLEGFILKIFDKNVLIDNLTIRLKSVANFSKANKKNNIYNFLKENENLSNIIPRY